MDDVRGVLLRTPLWVLILLGVGAGIGVAAWVSATQPTLYRAEGTLVVERGTQPLPGGPANEGLVRTLRELGDSDAVSQTVIANLGLHESSGAFHDRVSVKTAPGAAVLKISADASDKTRAFQIVQQLGLVLTKLVRDRFGQVTPGGREPLQVAVFDPPHVLPHRVSPRVGRTLGWGALFGLVAGLLAANLVAARRAPRLRVEAPLLLGEVGSDDGFDGVAARLLELAQEHPFQTVVFAGDADARIAAGIVAALTDRGESAAWARGDEADAAELAALAARNAFVLVGAPALDARLAAGADAVVAVTGGDLPPLDLLLGMRGVRLVGAVIANGLEAA
jgi:capsular polysaccharide biosynthesis protein